MTPDRTARSAVRVARGSGAAGAAKALPHLPFPSCHAAMLLQAGGRANALRSLIKAEQGRGPDFLDPDFLRLANALSALSPPGREEKRVLDAMLIAVPRSEVPERPVEVAMNLTRITVDPNQLGGVPCIRRLRIPVAKVVGIIADGMAEAEILAAYPDLQREDIHEALRHAADAARERGLPLAVQ